MNKLTYLCCPYTWSPEESFNIANDVAAKFMKDGNAIFSPISQSHPISFYMDKKLQTDHSFWMNMDLPMLKKCDELIAVVISKNYGYELLNNSRGCQEEIELAKKLNIPTKYFIYEYEVWKDVVGFEGFYQVSNKGRVKSLNRYTNHNYGGQALKKSKILKIQNYKNGYTYVHLMNLSYHKKVKIHRAVAEAFIPNPENKETVNHIDGDKSNNDISNLEWATWTENNNHARINKLNIPAVGEKIFQSKLKTCQVKEIIQIKKEQKISNAKIAKMYNVSSETIRSIVSRKSWIHVNL
jgi:DNA-binding transcriptional regulator YiaG